MSVSPLDSYQRMHDRRTGATTVASVARAKVWVDTDPWTERAVPPRPWIVPGHIMRGTITLVAGPGGAGKSALMVGWATAMALGLPLGKFQVNAPLRVLTYNVEDDMQEQRRRFSAALRQHGAIPGQIAGNVIRCGPDGVGTLLQRDALIGEMINTEAFDALEAVIVEHAPDVVMLDPLVELHSSEENENTALRLVVAHFRALAIKHNIGLVIVHHTRKGATAGEADDIRGGGAIVGAVRTAFTVMSMSKEEAEELEIPADQRRRFVRLDSAKGNYAPPQEAAWHELQDYVLDNGEEVAAIVPWTPKAAQTATSHDMALIEAELTRGTAGGPYSPRLAVDQPRSVAPLLAQHGFTSMAAQKKALKQLLTSGWRVERFRDRDGDPRNGLRSPEGLPEAKWLA